MQTLYDYYERMCRYRYYGILVNTSNTISLFSTGGKFCTFDRASLTPANVDILTSIHVWEKSELEEDNKPKQRVTVNEKFCRIRISHREKAVTNQQNFQRLEGR